MADTLLFLQLEHGTLTRMLGLLDQMRVDLERGEPVNGNLLALVLDYFRDYPDQCHHPKEDVVLRRLRARDPRAAASLEHLFDDHRDLRALTERVGEAVEHACDTGALHRPDLLEALAEFVHVYREHLEDEDRHFFPAISQHLGRDDWDLIDFALFEQEDPLFDQRAENRFRRLRELIWEGAERFVERTRDDVA